MYYPQPRGRPRKDAQWNHFEGEWQPVLRVDRSRSDAEPCWKATSFAMQAKEQAESQRQRAEALERERDQQLQRERDQQLQRERDEETELLRKEEARLNAPKMYAAQYAYLKCPVYYFDTCGTFQQLGHERVQRPVLAETIRKKKRTVPKRRRRVVGPRADLKLEEGESEYLSE